LTAELVFPHASDDAGGEVALVGSAGFAGGLALGGLAVEVGARDFEVSLLGDTRDVEHAVDPAVPAEVEAVRDGPSVAFAR